MSILGAEGSVGLMPRLVLVHVQIVMFCWLSRPIQQIEKVVRLCLIKFERMLPPVPMFSPMDGY